MKIDNLCDTTLEDTICNKVETNSNRVTSYDFGFQTEPDWKVGPNPTVDVVNVLGNIEIIETIEVFSITGEMLQLLNPSNAKTSIKLGAYPNGIYFVRIISDSGINKTYKIMKR